MKPPLKKSILKNNFRRKEKIFSLKKEKEMKISNELLKVKSYNVPSIKKSSTSSTDIYKNKESNIKKCFEMKDTDSEINIIPYNSLSIKNSMSTKLYASNAEFQSIRNEDTNTKKSI